MGISDSDSHCAVPLPGVERALGVVTLNSRRSGRAGRRVSARERAAGSWERARTAALLHSAAGPRGAPDPCSAAPARGGCLRHCRGGVAAGSPAPVLANGARPALKQPSRGRDGSRTRGPTEEPGVSTHPGLPQSATGTSALGTDRRTQSLFLRPASRAPHTPCVCTPAPLWHSNAGHRARWAPFPGPATPCTAHRLVPARPAPVCTHAVHPAVYTPPLSPHNIHTPHFHNQHLGYPNCLCSGLTSLREGESLVRPPTSSPQIMLRSVRICRNCQQRRGRIASHLQEAWEGRLWEEPKGTFSFLEAVCRLGLNMGAANGTVGEGALSLSLWWPTCR